MAITVLITLSSAGIDLGDFNLLSDTDGYTTPFETGITRGQLLGGYTSILVPDSTTTIRITSVGVCTNSVDIEVSVTTTTTTTATPTTTTTTTVAVAQPVASSRSNTSDVANACSLTTNTGTWIHTIGDITGETIAIGDVIYTTNALTTPFVGNGDYYKLTTSLGIVEISAQVNASGVVIGTSSICV